MSSKTLLCFGDSNTWGTATVPRPSGRYLWTERWPGVLAGELPGHWRVIEEGLGSRTTVFDDPVEGDFRNGARYLLPCLLSHQPLDLVAIMLGTNDLKARFAASSRDIAEGMGRLVQIVLSQPAGPEGRVAQVLLICPPPLQPNVTMHGELFAGGIQKSRQLTGEAERVAARLGVHFMDAGAATGFGTRDGFHLDLAGQRALGEAVAARVRQILGAD